MNYDKLTLPLAGAVLLGSLGALRADAWSDNNRVGLSYRLGFNMPLKIRNVAAPSAYLPSDPTGKTYQDGFVKYDDLGRAIDTANDATTYFGYGDGAYVTSGNGSMLLHNSSSGSIGPDAKDNAFNGMELTFDHELGRHQTWRWGIEGAFNWLNYSVAQTMSAPAGILGADAFQLGYAPIPAPPASYPGNPISGPGEQRLGVVATSVPVTVASDFDAKFYGIRLGPYLDLPVNDYFLVTFSAGLALTIVDGQFSYIESNPVQGVSSAANSSSVDALVGGYLGGQATVKLSKSVNVFVGLQFQSTESYKISAGTTQAEIDLSRSLYFSAGASYSF